MKKNELQNLREKTAEDLLKELQVIKDRLWKLVQDLKSGKVKNVREIRKLKKTAAVIQTLIKEKESKNK